LISRYFNSGTDAERFLKGFEVREVRISRQPPEAMKQVVEYDGNEGFYVVLVTEVLIDVEELVPRLE